MSKAEEFIKAKTKIGSNTTKGYRSRGVSIPSYSSPWVTPEVARKAVEIAREEIYEWLRVNLCDYFDAPRGDYDMCLDDLKQAMKDE